LVARAYASVGIKLHQTPDFCTPEDLKNSPLLELIENASVQVSEDEIKAYKQEGDATEGMREISNRLLQLAQKISPKILCLNDIQQLVMDQPELDSAIANAYRESGYFEYWQVDQKKYPWRYDSNVMFEFARQLQAAGQSDALVKYCIDAINSLQDGTFDHWHLNAEAARKTADEFPLETNRLLAELYEKLSNRHLERVAIAMHWLESKNLEASDQSL
jgi:hypothetical protein